ncbi:Metal transporter Nramp6 (ISS) [Dorcoceras hygrometricum]|uniref:Metal transporter Nramp6 (ISS) n=1 Tax=Dorcoceras hygrometricum TaxID=472368 RepID=A0A2Z7CN73_9LAMI|nr:Metal transporter Nramp6 (ISS) [Dorcoceras hygrometricum]
MSLFDLQDVCIAIGSIATLDLPMVVDLIGIYGLKGPYCTLTTTNWFLQALSVIPRGSWGDVARCFYHDPLGRSYYSVSETGVDPSDLIGDRSYDEVSVMGMNGMFTPKNPKPSSLAAPPSPLYKPPPPCAAAAASSPEFVSVNLDEENPSAPISSGLLVLADEGIPSPIMDLIDDIYRRLP